MIIIREIEHSDLDAILEMRLQWLSKQFNLTETTDQVRRWFSRYSENPMAFALVATDRASCVGYVLCDLLTHPTMSGVAARAFWAALSFEHHVLEYTSTTWNSHTLRPRMLPVKQTAPQALEGQ